MNYSQEKFENEKEIQNIKNYVIEKVVKEIDEETTIYGTLLTPKYRFDKIILIVSGSGKISQYAHNYLTEFFLENNIGVFRFDKRGVGKSTGRFNNGPKKYTHDFINIYTALEELETARHKKIGFLGHSLGGIVTIEAIKRKIIPDFLIQWATPVGKPRKIIKHQIKNGVTNYNDIIIGKTKEEQLNTLSYIHDLIDNNPRCSVRKLRKKAKRESKKNNINKKSFAKYLRPSYVDFARINNIKTYENIKIPTLVIMGSEDVLVDVTFTKSALKKIGNSNIEFKTIIGLNHFMTQRGVQEDSNEIYNVDMSFKESLINWIQKIKE